MHVEFNSKRFLKYSVQSIRTDVIMDTIYSMNLYLEPHLPFLQLLQQPHTHTHTHTPFIPSEHFECW